MEFLFNLGTGFASTDGPVPTEVRNQSQSGVHYMRYRALRKMTDPPDQFHHADFLVTLSDPLLCLRLRLQ